MAIVVVRYEYAQDPDGLATQTAVRPAHREFLGQQSNLLLAGPAGTGAVLLFEGEPGEVESMLDEDPFKDAGIITARRVEAWNTALGRWREPLGLA